MPPISHQDHAFDQAADAAVTVVHHLYHLALLRSVNATLTEDSQKERLGVDALAHLYDAATNRLSISFDTPRDMNGEDTTATRQFLEQFAAGHPSIASYDTEEKTFTLDLGSIAEFSTACTAEAKTIIKQWKEQERRFCASDILIGQLKTELPEHLPALNGALEAWLATVPPNNGTEQNVKIRSQLAAAIALFDQDGPIPADYAFLGNEAKDLLGQLNTVIFKTWLEPFRYRLNQLGTYSDLPYALSSAISNRMDMVKDKLSEGIEHSVNPLDSVVKLLYSISQYIGYGQQRGKKRYFWHSALQCPASA